MKMHEYGMHFIGTPYSWGGKDPAVSLDCSGFISELLRMKSYIGKGTFNSQGLYKKLIGKYSETPTEDSILFFGKSLSEITHVAIAIDRNLMIESGGEGRIETQKGFVRVRTIRSRRDFLTALTAKDL